MQVFLSIPLEQSYTETAIEDLISSTLLKIQNGSSLVANEAYLEVVENDARVTGALRVQIPAPSLVIIPKQ